MIVDETKLLMKFGKCTVDNKLLKEITLIPFQGQTELGYAKHISKNYWVIVANDSFL